MCADNHQHSLNNSYKTTATFLSSTNYKHISVYTLKYLSTGMRQLLWICRTLRRSRTHTCGANTYLTFTSLAYKVNLKFIHFIVVCRPCKYNKRMDKKSEDKGTWKNKVFRISYFRIEIQIDNSNYLSRPFPCVFY